MRHYSIRSTVARNPDARLHFEFSRASRHFFRDPIVTSRPTLEMLTRYIGRLQPLKTDIVKCGVHKCSSILDTTSKEAIGKSAKVQVRRALLRDFFASRNNTGRWPQRDVRRMSGRPRSTSSEQPPAVTFGRPWYFD